MNDTSEKETGRHRLGSGAGFRSIVLAAGLIFSGCTVAISASPGVPAPVAPKSDSGTTNQIPQEEPLFDMAAIQSDPVDVAILATEEVDGIVYQNIEYTSRVVDGIPERIQGIYAFPKGGTKLPAVFWSMGGMAAASRSFPGIMAGNGYACLAVTLPHKLRNSFRIPFDTRNPQTANLTLLARDQLRGITVLSQRPEVDPDRLAVAGASYGGVFATLIAGVDPRIKAGFSFFGGGNHAMGTSLPQFQKMESPGDVDVWNGTIDPAFRLKRRNIPFMWGVAFNDHWFHFPAVAQTFQDAAGPDKRFFIMPHWQHGFPPEVDQTLLHFLDTTPVAAHARPAYNAPGTLQVREENGKAVATFSWTGDNAVAKAELVVSYGEYTPWLGWPHRASFVFPAEISGKSASAVLPIPSRRLPLVAWGNITDDKQVLVSTPPLILSSDQLSGLPVVSDPGLNCFIDGDVAEQALTFYRLSGEPLSGVPEKDAACSGGQSLRIEPSKSLPTDPVKSGKAKPPKAPSGSFSIGQFHNVPGLAHRLTVRLKAESPTSLSVRLTPVRPVSWESAVVRQLVAKDPRLAPLLPRWSDAPEPIAITAPVGTTWQEVTLDVPVPLAPVDGYKLDISESPDRKTTYWIDTIRMQPVWPEQ